MTQPNQSAATEPNCGMPGRPGPAGHINACQLCPGSPTYWRASTAASATDQRACRWTKTPVEVGQP